MSGGAGTHPTGSERAWCSAFAKALERGKGWESRRDAALVPRRG
jgi:hypothetical protein